MSRVRDIRDILLARSETHGDFSLEARAVSAIHEELAALPSWHDLPPELRHAIYMTILKLVRTANGADPTGDSIADAIGYLTLARARSVAE
jgi:hypothetical protein